MTPNRIDLLPAPSVLPTSMIDTFGRGHAAERRNSSTSFSLLAAMLTALTLTGCGDLAHTNPLDPETPITVEVTGPDSAFSHFDTVSFVAHTSPSYSPHLVVWSSGGEGLTSLGNGAYFVDRGAAQAVSYTVRAVVDGREAEHVLKFVHRVTSLRARVCGSESRTAVIDALKGSVSLCVWGYDARGYSAPVGTPVVSASDFSIVSFSSPSYPLEPVYVSAEANGVAVMRFSAAGLSDSVVVTVRQRIANVRLDPAQCRGTGMVLSVGDTVQLSPTSVGTDSRGYLIADTARVRAAVSGMTYAIGWIDFGGVKVSPTGLVTAVGTGWSNVVGLAYPPGEPALGGVCEFHVQ